MYQRRSNPQLTLKPQDLLIVLKLWAARSRENLGYATLATETGLTKSEAYAAVRRADAARLLTLAHGPPKVASAALREFVLYGACYAFPATRTESTRGIPTSIGAEPLVGRFVSEPGQVPVWPTPEGNTRGPGLFPLYPSAPYASLCDPTLYRLLALFDAIREGRARERELARQLLAEQLQ